MRDIFNKLPLEVIVIVVQFLEDRVLAAIIGRPCKHDSFVGIIVAEMRKRAPIVSDEAVEAFLLSEPRSDIEKVQQLMEVNREYKVELYPKNIRIEYAMHSREDMRRFDTVSHYFFERDVFFHIELDWLEEDDLIDWSNVAERIRSIFGVKIRALAMKTKSKIVDLDQVVEHFGDVCFYIQQLEDGLQITFFKESYLDAKTLPRDITHLSLFNVVFKYSKREKFPFLRTCCFCQVRNTKAFTLNNSNIKMLVYQ